jgi:hypothetical protein
MLKNYWLVSDILEQARLSQASPSGIPRRVSSAYYIHPSPSNELCWKVLYLEEDLRLHIRRAKKHG